MELSYKNYRRIWFTLTVSYFGIGYLLINWLSSKRSNFYIFGFSFEQNIPFIPQFAFGYIVDYLSVVVIYFLIREREYFARMIKSYILLTTVHFVFFILLPVKMIYRPELSSETSIFGSIVRFFYWADMPYNCFPSLHVAYVLLGALVLWNYNRIWSYIYMAGTFIVAVSVIMLKQHYLLDVVAGCITPFFVYLLCFPRNKNLKDRIPFRSK